MNGQGALTGDGERVVCNLGGDVDASSPFRVICSTQARDVGDTSLVDVHHTVCETNKKDTQISI